MTYPAKDNSHTLVLVVEDNETNSDMVIRWLTKRGYRHNLAEDGQAAVRMATELMPDLILMDINLPKLSGWDATKLIKANDDTKHIPIIALTAKAFESDEAKSLQAGCDDHLSKPFQFSDLKEKMRRALALNPHDGPKS